MTDYIIEGKTERKHGILTFCLIVANVTSSHILLEYVTLSSPTLRAGTKVSPTGFTVKSHDNEQDNIILEIITLSKEKCYLT